MSFWIAVQYIFHTKTFHILALCFTHTFDESLVAAPGLSNLERPGRNFVVSKFLGNKMNCDPIYTCFKISSEVPSWWNYSLSHSLQLPMYCANHRAPCLCELTHTAVSKEAVGNFFSKFVFILLSCLSRLILEFIMSSI